MALARKTRFVLLAAAVLLLAAAALRDQIHAWLFPPPAQQVLQLSGNIEAHESELSFKTVQSRLIELPFDEGQAVKRGTVLARVDDSDYAQQVAISDAGLSVQQRQYDTAQQNRAAAGQTVRASIAEQALRQADYRRYATLYHQGFVSASYLDQLRAALKQADAALARDRELEAAAARNVKVAEAAIHNAEQSARLARIVRGYTMLTAPFDGVITTRQAELGEVVVPGTPVLTIADLDHVWLRGYLNETDLGRVHLGQPVTVTTDSHPGKHYAGRLSFISDKAEFTPKSVETHAERVALVYRVKIDIANPQHELVPGMPADAALDVNGRQP